MTENGFAVKGETDLPIEEALHDGPRVHYFEGTTKALLDAITIDGVDVRSYFPWSECFSVINRSSLLGACEATRSEYKDSFIPLL